MRGPFISAEEAIARLGQAVFVDARAEPGADEAFAQAHVAGARRAHLERDLSAVGDPAEGGRHPLPSMADWGAQVGRWGIEPSTCVILYDASGGGMAAARAWWMLRALGHEQAYVVDGGWQALRAAGVPTESREGDDAVDCGPYPSLVDQWPSVDAEMVERVRHDPSWCLVDARAPERYRGETEPLDPVAGHIPGARNLYWRSQLREDDCLDAGPAVTSRFEQALSGASPERVVCYCGSGVTACHLLLTMEAAGLVGAKLYVGSWSEWCRQGRARAGG